MKYWNELIAIEEQSIRLDCLKSLVNVVANGCDGSTREEVTNSLWHITGALEDINDKLKNAFNTCFDAVRDDSSDANYEEDDVPLTDEQHDQISDFDFLVNTEYKFDELQSVVNSWARNNPKE
jgi:hypothetical protein